ncbi:MAG: NAD(P) transhydrogenase subunit alpha [Thermoguttaceae bacterium]|nr:NAD(P) transhydrogenase subunit alpha [Thermoguttaceae bacterium]
MLAVFAAAFAVGYALIARVPTRLHTPLMSMTNAISAVTVLGALVLFAEDLWPWQRGLGAVALAAAAFNVIGGFAITHRMLRLFKARQDEPEGNDRPVRQ